MTDMQGNQLPEATGTEPRAGRGQRLAVAALLAAAVGLWLAQVSVKTPTFDEVGDIATGIMQVDDGDYTFNNSHAALMPTLSAIMLAPLTVHLPPLVREPYDYWRTHEWSRQLLYASGNQPEAMLFFARLPSLGFWLLLLVFIFLWGRETLGRRGALLALALGVFSPGLAGWAAVASTDLAITAGYFVTLYFARHYLAARRRRLLVLAALFAGLTLAAKPFALLPLLALPLLWMLTAHRQRWPLAVWRSELLRLPWALLLAGMVLWGSYRFNVEPALAHPDRDWCALEALPLPAQQVVAWLAVNKVPLPAPDYFEGIMMMRLISQQPQAGFYLGEYIPDTSAGTWYYAVAFVMKNPAALLLMLLVSGAAARRLAGADDIFLLLPALLVLGYGFACPYLGMSRFFYPAYPFLFLFAARVARAGSGLVRSAAGTTLLAAAAALPVLLAVPHLAAYVDPLFGGTAQGYRTLCLTDVDSGQDLRLLADRLATLGGAAAWQVTPAWPANPERYLQPFRPFPEAAVMQRRPGRYAVSVSYQQGFCDSRRAAYQWLWREEPVASIGGSVKLYVIAPDSLPAAAK